MLCLKATHELLSNCFHFIIDLNIEYLQPSHFAHTILSSSHYSTIKQPPFRPFKHLQHLVSFKMPSQSHRSGGSHHHSPRSGGSHHQSSRSGGSPQQSSRSSPPALTRRPYPDYRYFGPVDHWDDIIQYEFGSGQKAWLVDYCKLASTLYPWQTTYSLMRNAFHNRWDGWPEITCAQLYVEIYLDHPEDYRAGEHGFASYVASEMKRDRWGNSPWGHASLSWYDRNARRQIERNGR